MTEFPKARPASDFILRPLDDELLAYDLANHKVTALSPIAARVWEACDGQTSASAIAGTIGSDSGTVDLALHRLSEAGMLAATARKLDRRSLMRYATAAGAAAAVVTVVSPTPAQALSCADGSTGVECCVREDCPDPWMPLCSEGFCVEDF